VLYVDRIKDIINRGGIKISAAEVESYLLSQPAVHAAAVVAIPDDRLGERGCASSSPGTGHQVTLDDVKAHLRKLGVRTQKWPEVLHGVAEFPTTTTGKVGKVELREQARTKASEDGNQVDIPQTT
jgi:non-ribosomal peptide synthetase component E (peptide arylation enzyme)